MKCSSIYSNLFTFFNSLKVMNGTQSKSAYHCFPVKKFQFVAHHKKHFYEDFMLIFFFFLCECVCLC